MDKYLGKVLLEDIRHSATERLCLVMAFDFNDFMSVEKSSDVEYVFASSLNAVKAVIPSRIIETVNFKDRKDQGLVRDFVRKIFNRHVD